MSEPGRPSVIRCRQTGRARHRTRDAAIGYREVLRQLTADDPHPRAWWVVHCLACKGWHLYVPGDPNRAWLLLPSSALLARSRARHARAAAKSGAAGARSGTLDPTAPALR